MIPRLLLVACLLATVSGPGFADEPKPDTSEPGTREAIAAATTEARFLSAWVADVPASATVPSPTKFLGHVAGAPGELTHTDKIYAYYRALAAATDRVKVEAIGKSEEGRELLLVFVGDGSSLKELDRTRVDMADLADPRRTDEAAMERIVARTKPLYMLHGGLHSEETGSPEMLMELAYRLAVSDAPLVREIRDRLVVLINPVAEPDGRDREVDWFYKNLKGKTDYDSLPPTGPPYWGKYVFHDNNRDGVQRKLPLTRATQDAFLRWHPVVVHDLHESIPLLSIWTGTGPYSPTLDPIAASEWHALSFHEVTTLTSLGLPGVWTWGFGEGFAQVFADSVAVNHNAIAHGYETFGNGTAETVERVIDPDERFTGKAVTEPDWYRALPPPKRFKWSLRDNTNYMETGVLAALQYSAHNAADMLRNFWRRGRNAVQKGGSEKPYAVAIPEKQDDRNRLARLVNLLREHGIEVSRAKESFTVKEGTFPAGTFLVRMDQPYRSWALELLLPQKYPADKALYPAYDDVSWALPVSLGVETKPIEDPSVRQLATSLVSDLVRYKGDIATAGAVYLVRDVGQEAFLAARVRLAKFKVEAAEKPFSSGGTDYPAGSWVIAAQPNLRPALEAVAADLAIDIDAADAAPSVPRHSLDLPRLAVLQTWYDTQGPGWVRMIFDDEKVPYTLIMDDDVKRGGLSERFDVILFPETDGGLKGIVNGFDSKDSPLPYVKAAQFPTLGTPTSSPDITGGLGWRGVANIEDFVRKGGLLVTLGGASSLPLDGGIAHDVRRASVKDAYVPGSELRARFRRPDHPLAYGYKEETTALRENLAFYAVRRWDRGRVVLQWGTEIPKDDGEDDPAESKDEKKAPLVVSGGIKGGGDVEGKAAILDIPTGKGRVVAFDFDPIHRYLTQSSFRLAWNAILNWNDLPPTPKAP
ncbi:MAG: M14 family zinc carboxypeptidase [Vicinamibacteria bacterium]